MAGASSDTLASPTRVCVCVCERERERERECVRDSVAGTSSDTLASPTPGMHLVQALVFNSSCPSLLLSSLELSDANVYEL